MIIGILGRKRCGKDTVADYMVKKYNYKKIAFADPLKNACQVLFNFDDNQLYGDKKEDLDEYWNVAPRKVLQYIGTDIFRQDIQNIVPNIGEDFWVKSTMKKIKDIQHNYIYQPIVISDVRFQNEIDYIHQNDGVVIKLERNTLSDNHQSEKDIDMLESDYLVVNNKTKDALYKNIDDILFNVSK